MKNEKYTKTKKIAGIGLSSVLLAATLVGAGFGIANSVENMGGVDTNYNDFVQIEADVNFLNRNADIKDAAKSIDDTLDFLGMQNATIRTMGDSKIIINNPIETYTYKEFNIMNSTEDHLDLMNDTANKNYFNEISTLMIPLFFDGTLDVRDIEGDVAFAESEINGSSTWQFVGGVEDGGTFGVETDTETGSETGSETASLSIEDSYVENFFEYAELKHSSGSPVIELHLKEGHNGTYEYVNMFKEFDSYIDATANSTNPTRYVFWFNYDLTYDLVQLVDSEGLSTAGSLYDYVTSNGTLRPLYVTSGTTSVMSSIYSDTVELTGSFSEQQAEYFVNRINNSSRFQYSNIDFEVIINLQTKIMLIVFGSILLLLILVVIFTFVAYFGLLGMIASAIFLLTNLTMIMIISSTGILITGLGLVALGMIISSSAIMIFVTVNTYKNNNEDKFLTVNKVGADKLKEIHSLIFVPMVASVLIFYVSGLIVTTLIAIPLYLIVIGLVLSYLFVSMFLIPLLYGLDSLLSWTRFEYTKKWDFFIGFNNSFTNGASSNNDATVDHSGNQKKSLISTLVAVGILALSVIVGGTLYGTTGSALNSTTYGTENYSYVVQATADKAWMNLEKDNSPVSEDRGVDMRHTYYEETKKVTSDVESVFEDNGIKVSSINVIRVDEVELDTTTNEHTLYGSFGFEIYSKNAMNVKNANGIQSDLSDMAAIQLTPDDAVLDTKTQFELSERMSWNGEESIKMINYKDNTTLISGVYALLVMSLVLAIILLFVGNWGIALASLITTLLEIVLIVSPLVIFYIPISVISVFTILLLAGVSFSIKTIITKKAKSDEIETDKWERAANRNKYSMFIFSAFLLFFELLLIGIYAFIALLPMIIVTILAPFAIYLTQQYVFPTIASTLDSRRGKTSKRQLEKDIEDSKDPKDGLPREEYIEGVNM